MKTDSETLRRVRRTLLSGLGEIEAQLGIHPTTAQLWDWQYKRAKGGWYSEQPEQSEGTEKAPGK